MSVTGKANFPLRRASKSYFFSRTIIASAVALLPAISLFADSSIELGRPFDLGPTTSTWAPRAPIRSFDLQEFHLTLSPPPKAPNIQLPPLTSSIGDFAYDNNFSSKLRISPLPASTSSIATPPQSLTTPVAELRTQNLLTLELGSTTALTLPLAGINFEIPSSSHNPSLRLSPNAFLKADPSESIFHQKASIGVIPVTGRAIPDGLDMETMQINPTLAKDLAYASGKTLSAMAAAEYLLTSAVNIRRAVVTTLLAAIADVMTEQVKKRSEAVPIVAQELDQEALMRYGRWVSAYKAYHESLVEIAGEKESLGIYDWHKLPEGTELRKEYEILCERTAFQQRAYEEFITRQNEVNAYWRSQGKKYVK